MLYLKPEERPEKAVLAPEWPSRFAALAAEARDPRMRAFYGAGVPAGDTPLAQVPMMALDFETTGFDPERNAIVSIGMMPFSIRRIRMNEARHWVVKPRKPLAESSIVIHGITHSDISRAPDLDEILGDFLQALAGHIAVVHHRGIERPFLNAALHERLGEGIEFPVIDTMDLEARLHRKKTPGLFARLLGRKPVSIRLANSRSRYHLPFYQPHNALTDAQATAELLQAQIAQRFGEDVLLRDLWR